MPVKIPFNPDAENALIGMLFTYPEQIERVLESLDTDCLYSPTAKAVLKKAIEYWQEYQELDKYKFQNFVSVEQYQYISKCVTEHSYRSAQFPRVIQKVKEWHQRRELWKLASFLLEKTTERNDFNAILARVMSDVNQIDTTGEDKIKSLTELIKEYMNPEFYENISNTVLPTGWIDFDKALTIHNGDLILIAGRPSNGKTAFMLSLALESAKRGNPAGIFSLEMRSEYLLKRMAEKMAFGAGLEGYPEFEYGCKKLHGIDVYFDDHPKTGIMSLRSKIKRMVNMGVKAIYIDYLTLLDLPHGENQNLKVAEASRNLKLFSGYFNIPIFVLSQLSRAVETRSDKKPTLADLRDSGALEQDADKVLFCYNPGKYNLAPEGISNPDKYFELVIAKQRNGVTTELPFFWEKSKHFFSPWEDHQTTQEAINYQEKRRDLF